MAFLVEAYTEDEAPNAKGGVDTRTVLQARPAPGAGEGRRPAAVAQRRPLAQGPRPRRRRCGKNWNVDFDDAGAIGRRYRRQDEIGTPFCLTVDFDTLDDQAVTMRERDSMSQERGRRWTRSTAYLAAAPPRLLTATVLATPKSPGLQAAKVAVTRMTAVMGDP